MAKKQDAKVRWIRRHELDEFSEAVFWLKQAAKRACEALEKRDEALDADVRKMLAADLRQVLDRFVYDDAEAR